ncbi:uncharacterized protein MYCFIDRAFT_189745 [Pseudocercospora fijiensis CIRAD86]|uniref:Uncharacterized protein n=1 Tax=Pseudocercospora fijiensis (strain CIRAD86) TaxID=383855 RepID=M3ASC7_PSEFD|nr:uncharacterized protein MYCFIDRAFT_189745 [Pseudocercospora fijiensis CIRAD86]EME80063.1 hypothetical protein MYCFIDRAFT_189745 [Pseudocercospora fijiensis CIRAD86]
MTDRTVVLIAEANTGIGHATVQALLQSDRSYRIFLGGRDLVRAENAAMSLKDEASETNSEVDPIQIDVDSDASIVTALATISSKVDRVDVIINNASASFDSQIHKGQLTVRDAWNKCWNTNVTGANIITETFLPLLLKSKDPRLLFVTSGASSLADAADAHHLMHKVPPPGLPKPPSNSAYRSSKAGLNMMMLEWHRLLKNDGVKVWCVAPGLPSTGLGNEPERLRKSSGGDLSLGGQAILGVVEGKRDSHVGRVVREYGDSKIQAW